MAKDESSPPCNTEVMDIERGTAASLQGCPKDERRRELSGDEEESQQPLTLPEDALCLETATSTDGKGAALALRMQPPSRVGRHRSPSRMRRSMSPNHRRRSIDRSITAEPRESRREEGDALKENTEEREETAGKWDSERGEMARCDKEEKMDIVRGTAAVAWSAESRANAVGDPVTEGTIAANSERKPAAAIAVETGDESIPLRAAAAATPVLLPVPVPVPTARTLRMFLGVLKHNPVGLIREVGVLLMLHVSSTEVAIAARAAAAAAAAAENPSALSSNGGRNSGGKRGRGQQPQVKLRRESDHQKRRAEEATAVLALALAADKRRVGRLAAAAAAAGVTAARVTKNNKTRFQHQLRQPEKVEDRLQTWAATRGREVAALKELLALSAGGELDASSAGARLVRDRACRISVGQVGKALPEAGQVLEFLSSATGVVAQDCVGSVASADAPVGLDRGPIAQDDSCASGGKDEPSEVAGPSRRSPSDPAIQESSISNSDGRPDQRIEDASRDLRSSGDPVVLETLSSDATPNSQQRSEEDAPLRPLSSDEPVIWDESTTASEQRADGVLLGFSSDDDTHDSLERVSGGPTLPLGDEDKESLAPDLEQRIWCCSSRFESSMERELAQSGGEAALLSSSSSEGDGSTTAAAATIAAKEKASDLLDGGVFPSVNEYAVAADGAAGEEVADANWLSGPSDEEPSASPSRASNGASVTTWETSSSEAESEQQHGAAGSPADIGTVPASLEDRQLNLKMPSIWPADPLAKNTDPFGDISLVSEDGERNLWDDILDEQLSKCRPVQIRATGRISRNVQPGDVRPSVAITNDESGLVTGDSEEESEEKAGEGKEEEEESNEQELDSGEGGARRGADGEDIEDKAGEDVPHAPPSSSLSFDSIRPSLGLTSDALQQEEGEGEEEEGEREEGQQEEEQGQAAMGLSLALQYAYLLDQACGSMLDVIQGANVDSSVARAVDSAAAAASTAQGAVAEAVALLDKHLAELPNGASKRSKLQRSLSPSSLSFSEVITETTRRDRQPVEQGSGGVDDGTPTGGEDDEESHEGEKMGEETNEGKRGTVSDKGRSSGDGCPGEVDDGTPAWEAVAEDGQEGQEVEEEKIEEESVLPARPTGYPSFARQKADIYWAEVGAEATAAVAAELAERATSAASAYERTREIGHGGRSDGEASRGGLQQLPRLGKCEYFDAWLESRLAAAAAATASRAAAAMARRAATLTAASKMAPAPAAGEGAAEASQRAENYRLLHEGGAGEGGGEQSPERRKGGNHGRRRKYSSSSFNVDPGAWNWAGVGGGGGGGMADGGHGVRVLKDEGEGREAGEGRAFCGKWGVVSQGGCSPGGGSVRFGTAATAAILRPRCGKPWGSVDAESKLRVQWYVEKNPGNMGGSLAQLCHQIERKEERRERRRRAPEMEDIRKKKLAAREQNGGISPRSGLMGHSWQFPRRTPNPSPYLPSSASVSSGSTTSASPSSTSFTLTSASAGLGLAWDGPASPLTPPPTAMAWDAAATEPAVAAYRLSDRHAEMTERWPAGLLGASKALIAEVPGLEEYGRQTFEAVLECSVRRGVMGHTRREGTG